MFKKMVFPAMMVLGAVLNVVSMVLVVRETGMGLMEFLSLSDFGWFIALWNFNPVLVLMSMALFFGGFIGIASRMR